MHNAVTPARADWRIGAAVSDDGPFASGIGRLLRRFRYAELPPADCRLVAARTAVNAGCEPLRRALGPVQVAGLATRQRILLDAADELHRDRFLGDHTWARLDLTPAQRVELCFLVGHVDLIAMLHNSFGEAPLPDAVVTPLRPGRTLTNPQWQLPASPRLPEPTLAEIGARTWLFSKGVGLLNGGGSVDGVEMFSRSPRLFWSVVPFLLRLGPLRIGRELGEIVTLRATWNVGSEYHWGHHGQAARFAGLSEADIARIPAGATAAGWSDRETLVLTAVDELHERRALSAPTRTALSALYGTAQITEICLVTGNYEMLCMALNSFGIRFEHGAWQGGLAAPVWSVLARRGGKARRPSRG